MNKPKQGPDAAGASGAVDTCVTCQLVENRSRPAVPDWDAIVRTEHWDLAHANDTSHFGWLILITKNHRASIADLTDAEAKELGPLTRDVSIALRDITGCSKTYLAQFAESPQHQHVHVHVIARTDELNPDHRGPFVFAELGAPPERQVEENRLNELASQLRDHPVLASYGEPTKPDR